MSVYLYRLFDGKSYWTALTLGHWWIRRRLLKRIVHAVPGAHTQEGHARVLEFMRASMFVHPGWNHAADIARLSLPPGCSIPVITGLGDWRAIKEAANDHCFRGILWLKLSTT
jgi:hypothetical protein